MFSKYHAPLLICIILTAVLLWLPTGYEEALQYQSAHRCVAEVLATDDSSIVDTGLVRSGEQRCTLRIKNGTFRGEEVTGINMLRIPGELLMAAGFVIFLILFAGKTGLRAIFSFVVTVLMLWKVLVPLCLVPFSESW